MGTKFSGVDRRGLARAEGQHPASRRLSHRGENRAPQASFRGLPIGEGDKSVQRGRLTLGNMLTDDVGYLAADTSVLSGGDLLKLLEDFAADTGGKDNGLTEHVYILPW